MSDVVIRKEFDGSVPFVIRIMYTVFSSLSLLYMNNTGLGYAD